MIHSFCIFGPNITQTKSDKYHLTPKFHFKKLPNTLQTILLRQIIVLVPESNIWISMKGIKSVCTLIVKC